MNPDLTIVVMAQNPARAAILKEGAREVGKVDLIGTGGAAELAAGLRALDPDVILIDLEQPSQDDFNLMLELVRAINRPIAVFLDDSDAPAIEAAVAAGVSAFVIGDLRKDRIKHIIRLSIARFNALARLREELERARRALEERKLIERAKGILMRTRNLSEEAAYGLLRKSAMQEQKTIADIAQSVITAANLLNK
jgi:response regulator NasT